MPWNLGDDSPLLGLVDGSRRRATFAIAPRPLRPLAPVDGLLAGATEVDITPPPGLPKAGYSANANTGTGFRTRLRARVVHLRAGTASLALVQCDLLGGSSVVQHLVARAIAETTDVPLAGLFLGATHTHAGPGNFLGSDFYNRFASNKAGFDAAYTQFLAARIAGAVEESVAHRRPARLAVGQAEVWGLTRNRSLEPHVRNPEVQDKRTAPQRKFLAINPLLHLLRVDTVSIAGHSEPLAAALVFSVHGTGIPSRTHEYNADLWAYVTGELAHRIERAHGRRAVVGAMQGAHADVAPAIRPGLAGHDEAARIGRAIGSQAAALYEQLEGGLSDAVTLAAGLREVDLDRDATIGGIALPPRPAIGAALVAGATENTTPVIHRIPPFRAGTPKRWGRQGAQGPKWVLGSRWLQPLLLPRRGFPRVLPMQVLRIGHTLITGLPFEITVETGRRIEGAIASAIEGSGVTEVIVSSVANEYVGYASTPEEYELQFYEGGHTIYGPKTQPFLAAHAARLATEVLAATMLQDVLVERRFDMHCRRYLPFRSTLDDAAGARSGGGPATFSDPTKIADAYWEWRWSDVPPGDLDWHDPLVRVEAADGHGTWHPAVTPDGRPADDRGWDLEVGHVGPAGEPRTAPPSGAGGSHHYWVRWWNPTLRGDRRHRFVLLANARQPVLISEPFD